MIKDGKGLSGLSQAFKHSTSIPTFVLVFLLITPLAAVFLILQSSSSPGAYFSNSTAEASKKSVTLPQNEDVECTNWQAPSEAEGDPWVYVKGAMRPAPCKVRGFVVEALDPEFNFRHPYAVGFTKDQEDKSFITNYFLAYQDLSLHKSSRRILLDLGGSFFKTSTGFFIREYPLDFTEIHTFERVKDKFKIPSAPSSEVEKNTLHPMNSKSKRRETVAPIPSWILSRIKTYNRYVSTHSVKGRSIDITYFIKEVLKVKPKDALIIKMDVEGAEWDIFEAWLADPVMATLIDEIFVEIHYHHPSMKAFNWDDFSHTREEATEILEKLRSSGIVTHPWP